MSPFGLALLGAFPVAGCGHEGDENLGLASRHRDTAVDVRGLTRPGELERALALPSEEAEKRLGPHRLSAVTNLSLVSGVSGVSGETSDRLDETFTLDVDGQGGSHLTRVNSHGYGIEAIATGGSYYVCPRYGRFVRHSPEGDEVLRARDEVQGLAAGYLGLLGRFAARSDGGTVTLHGRTAVEVKLTLAPAPGALSDPDPAHAWRAAVTVSALDGEVWIDAATGAPLHVKLDAKYRSQRDARTVAVTMHYQSDVEEMGAVAPIAVPADAEPPVARVRPLVDRQALLDGLAPGHGEKRLQDDAVPRLDAAGRGKSVGEGREAP